MGLRGMPAGFHDPTDHAGDELGRCDAVLIVELRTPPLKPVRQITMLRGACFDNRFTMQPPSFVRVRVPTHRHPKINHFLLNRSLGLRGPPGEPINHIPPDTNHFAVPDPGLGSPHDTKPPGEFSFQGGVIQPRPALLISHQRPRIQRQPPTIRSLDLRADDGVSMNLRVPRPRRELMRQPHRQALRIHTHQRLIRQPVPGPGLTLDLTNHGFHRSDMPPMQFTAGRLVTERPHQRHCFRGRERRIKRPLRRRRPTAVLLLKRPTQHLTSAGVNTPDDRTERLMRQRTRQAETVRPTPEPFSAF